MKKSELKKSTVWRRFRRNKPAMIGLCILTVILLAIIIGGFLIDYETQVIRNNARERLQPPSAAHWFGTDSVGRDVFSRIIYGGRYSISIGILITAISGIIGAIIGAACGYFGGWFDNLVMRFVDLINATPGMLLLLAIVASLGASFENLVLAMCIGTVPGFIRLIRSSVINLTGVEYVEAAKSYGSGNFRIILKHVLPNALGVLIVNCAGTVSSCIQAAAGLSFLGFGVQPPLPEWGVMLSDAKLYMVSAPWCMLAPGLAIFLTALSINLIGDGMRDALDPRLKD